MNTVFITGINGMAGSLLAESYLARGWKVHGTIRERSRHDFLSGIENKIVLHTVDVRDAHGIYRALQGTFDIVHHLAAQTYVPSSWSNPTDTVTTNILGSLNILEAVRIHRGRYYNPIVHVAGTSEEYGAVNADETPIKETNLLRPTSPYGVSKVTADLLFQQYHRSYQMRTVITRAFNHTHDRRGDNFVEKIIVRQAAEIKKGLRKTFELGNLESIRDFTDARDMIDAYHLAVEKCDFGEPYNVCRGVGYPIKELVQMVATIAGIDPKTEQVESRMRPSDNPVFVGDNTKFVDKTGWMPKYRLMETLTTMYEYELARLAGAVTVNA